MEPQVFDLLVFLVGNRDRVVSKDDLLTAVWGGRIVSESTIATRINAVRRVIGDNGEQQRLIRTIIGKGVRFVGAVREARKPVEIRSAYVEEDRRANDLVPPDKPSVAVLPFTNMSGNPEQEFVADGIAEDNRLLGQRCLATKHERWALALFDRAARHGAARNELDRTLGEYFLKTHDYEMAGRFLQAANTTASQYQGQVKRS